MRPSTNRLEMRAMAVGALFAAGALAQANDVGIPPKEQARRAAQQVRGGDVLGVAVVQRANEATAVVEGSEDGGRVKANIAVDFGPTQVRLQFEAPLSKSTGEATFLTLDQLPGDAVIAAEMAHAWIVGGHSIAAACAVANELVLDEFTTSRRISSAPPWRPLSARFDSPKDASAPALAAHAASLARQLGDWQLQARPTLLDQRATAAQALCDAEQAVGGPIAIPRLGGIPHDELSRRMGGRAALGCTLRSVLASRLLRERIAPEADQQAIYRAAVRALAATTVGSPPPPSPSNPVSLVRPVEASQIPQHAQNVVEAAQALPTPPDWSKSIVDDLSAWYFDASACGGKPGGTVDGEFERAIAGFQGVSHPQATGNSKQVCGEAERVLKQYLVALVPKLDELWAKYAVAPASRLFTEDESSCTAGALSERVSQMPRGKERVRLFGAFASALPKTLTLSLRGEAASRDLQWFGAVPPVVEQGGTIPLEKDSKVASSLKLGGALGSGRWLLSAVYSRVRTYSEADAIEICAPLASGAGQSCAKAAAASPARKEADVLKIGARFVKSPELAWELNGSYDFTTNTLNPHFLAYFIPIDKKQDGGKLKQLRGGIDLGYLRNHPKLGDRFLARLFVGVPVGLPGRAGG